MTEYKQAPEDKIKYSLQLYNALKYAEHKTFLDVGAGENPLKFATHVIDYLDYENRGLSQGYIKDTERFTRETWNKADFFSIPWDYEDKQFDFVHCCQVLEDIRDPIAVCKEMMRVGKLGYIECPNLVSELSHKFFHHRWFVRNFEGKLQFLHKSPTLIIQEETYNNILKLDKQREHQNRITALIWTDHFEAEEVYCKNEKEYIQTICEWLQHDIDIHGGLQTEDKQCNWRCPACNKRCGGVFGHSGDHQCPIHYIQT